MSIANASLPVGAADDRNRLEALTRINLQDLLDNFGLSRMRWLQHGWLRRGLERLFWLPAEHFARLVMAFDGQVGESGLQTASRAFLLRHVRELRVIGAEHVPADGPVIFAANHAGMSESLACFGAIPRHDLCVVANDRPFVRALPNLFARLIAVPEHEGGRFAVVRQVTRHLEGGHALFINPAGQIEPDPACMPGALESLQTWSPSLGVFVRRVPNVRLVPTLVYGVILPATLRHPLVRWRRTSKDRERSAAAVQLLIHMQQQERTPVTPVVTFGRPLDGRALVRLGDAGAIVRAVVAEMSDMMSVVVARRTSRDRSA